MKVPGTDRSPAALGKDESPGVESVRPEVAEEVVSFDVLKVTEGREW